MLRRSWLTARWQAIRPSVDTLFISVSFPDFGSIEKLVMIPSFPSSLTAYRNLPVGSRVTQEGLATSPASSGSVSLPLLLSNLDTYTPLLFGPVYVPKKTKYSAAATGGSKYVIAVITSTQ